MKEMSEQYKVMFKEEALPFLPCDFKKIKDSIIITNRENSHVANYRVLQPKATLRIWKLDVLNVLTETEQKIVQ